MKVYECIKSYTNKEIGIKYNETDKPFWFKNYNSIKEFIEKSPLWVRYFKLYEDKINKVLPDKQKQIDSFCVRVTEENKEVVEKWRGVVLPLNSYVGFSYGIHKNGSKEHSINSDWKPWFKTLLTTEQFYEKIGHKVELTKEELLEEARKRYKVGDIIIDADFGDTVQILSTNFTYDKVTNTVHCETTKGEKGNLSFNDVYRKGKWADIVSTKTENKSLVGRWLKALVDGPQMTNLKKGDYIKIKSDNFENSVDLEHNICNYVANKQKFGIDWELMPEGFNPEKEKYDYEVVHCTTQEEWDFVNSKLDSYLRLSSGVWSVHEEFTGKCINKNEYGRISFYEKQNSKIYSFNEWCNKFGHLPISVELYKQTPDFEIKHFNIDDFKQKEEIQFYYPKKEKVVKKEVKNIKFIKTNLITI